MTLTANELKFNRNEALFLTQMLVPLELMLTKDLFNEYSVRLSMLRGTKENDNDFLNHAIDILCENEIEVMSANKVTIKYCAIKSILESQSRESMSQMMAEHNFDQLIKILMSKPESELTADEIELLNEAIVSSELWQKGVDILSTRNDLNKECLITIQKCLETGKRARLKHPLAVKLVKLAAEGYSVLPWICLYWGLIAEGYVATNAKSQLITYLKLGHQYLGRRGTCTSHNGQFLLLALNHFIDVDVEDEIFRCFTCLYNFPVRRVASGPSVSNSNIHKSPHISLKWDYCEQLYDYFAPEELPEYDSLVRQTGITQDIEGLLLRVLELVPKHLQPNDKTDPIMKYIDSGDAIGGDVTTETTHITETIYYLLADYYFKNKEFNKARHFYVLDLTLNPNRFDSWAASALTRNFEVDQQLLSGENFEQSFFDLTFASQRCFQRALQLEPTATKLWIEFGHFVYNITSTTVRLRKTSLFATSQSELTTGAIDDSIQMAKDCFEKALKTDSGDEELWLPYYMLGKVCEKSSKTLGTGALLMAIRYYEWAEMCLFVDGTSYPKKIQYYNPPYLAVEALEIHYRIHVAILKYLTLHKKVSSRLLKRLRMHLIRALRSPFSKQTAPSSATSVAPVDHDYATAAAGVSGYQRSLSTDSVSELMNDLVDTVALREERVEIGSLREQLVMMCLRAMHRCVNRYPAHYKSIYRLANYYFLKNNYIMAKQLLVGQVVLRPQDHGAGGDGQDLTESVKLIPGLFAERKNNNLFNGIWRIPIDDIDRPGSFSAHMFRSTWLLIRVCTFTQDYQMLCTIAIQLARTPDKDKQFLRNSDRQILAKFSFESCNLLLKSHYGLSPMRDKVLMDVQRIHERLTKAGVFVSEANAMIREFIPAYRR
ncbi:unnamed protein product [Oppiella nova]|uniref:Uncharacterized protein n=1 Tax=Oppiella nova TaxID=334625 RepID=A0A7R9LU16_9ACAR|nr:unnamed protein product [Oppiella nova]CAG2166979.1 unnamed protein product [Oppiella nova]